MVAFWPRWIAASRGVTPVLFWRPGSAPWASRASTVAGLLLAMAARRGVVPLKSARLVSAPWSRSRVAVSLSWFWRGMGAGSKCFGMQVYVGC